MLVLRHNTPGTEIYQYMYIVQGQEMGKIPWGAAGRTRISKPLNMGFVTKRHNKGREKLSLFQLSSSSTGRRGSGRVSGLRYDVTSWWYTRVAL